MNKICTYVGTTLCTIFFFLTTAQAQNNSPIQVGFNLSTTQHIPDTINIYDIVTDPDGDRLFIKQTQPLYHAYGITRLLSDTVLVYSPYMSDCGDIGIPIFVIICDTSVIYNNSFCDTFYLDVHNECTWTPITVDVQPSVDTVCNNEWRYYYLGGIGAGGSTHYRYELSSSNADDSVLSDPFSTHYSNVKFNGYGNRTITLKIVDELSGDSIENILYADIHVRKNFEGYIDTDTTLTSGMHFIVQEQPQPQAYAHSISWWDADTILLQSTSIDPGIAQQHVDQALIFCPDTSGFYFISLHDHATNCVYYADAYYTGINHQLNGDSYSWSPYYTTTSAPPLHIENYLVEDNGYCVERIRYTDLVTTPAKGTASYINGEMYYTPNGQCGTDSFWAIGCDTSKFLPHSTCDTLLVIVEVNCVISAQAFVVQNASCFGFADGSASVIVQGTTSNPNDLTYLWNNGATTATINGLVAGTYSVTITYQNYTTAVATVTITQPFAPLQPTVQTQNACGVGCSGSSTITMFGGTAPYTYMWSNFSTASNLTNLCIGTYTGTISDAMGCTVSPVFTIMQDTASITVSFDKQDIDCDSAWGYLIANPNNGVAPYAYNWSTGGIGQSQYQLPEGTYTVTVFDATGCASTATATILNNSGLNANITDSLLPSCNGATNGMVQIAPAGGVAPYTYAWTGNASTTNTATGLGVGAHTVIVSDNGGCSFAYQFSLAPQTVLNVSTTTVSANCTPNAQGQVTVQVSNGTPPYTYDWNTSATGSTIQGPAGVYQVTVADSNGCSAVGSASIYNHSLFMSAYSQPENCGQSNGRANVIVYNGVSPYSYEWNNDVNLNNDTLYNAGNGIQTIKVTDALGCQRTVQIEVLADCYAMLEGTLFNDVNGDCIKQITETQPVAQSTIKSTGLSHTYYGTVYPNGNYTIIVRDTGNYEVSLNLSPCLVLCPATVANVPALNNSYAVNSIGYRSSIDEHDFRLGVSVVGLNPGFTTTYYLTVTSGNNPQNINPSVTLNYSPHLAFVSVVNAIADTVAHTITWPSVSLSPQGLANLSASFTVPIGTAIGTSIVSTAAVQPDSNDCYPENNSLTITRPVTGSYDPNMKVANPATEISETDSVLHYTIHFQNTGNDTTHFIVLKDTLSELVDPASFEFGGSSHQPCRHNISGTGILTFTFDPIYLPDSATNEDGSKGYVSYSIKKKATTEIGEVIRNTAHIYFDFNPAIVTNTTENEVTTLVSIQDIKSDNNLTARVYPNPFTETATIELSEQVPDARLVVTNLTGQVVQEYSSETGKLWLISKNGLAQGMYAFTIYGGGIVKMRGKLLAE